MISLEGINGTHRVGVGLPDFAAVEALKHSLLARGAELVVADPQAHKYFLRLNPTDMLLLEIFFDSEGPSMHIDFTVGSLEGVRSVHGTALYDYGILNMLFLDAPGMPNLYPFSIQLAFAKR